MKAKLIFLFIGGFCLGMICYLLFLSGFDMSQSNEHVVPLISFGLLFISSIAYYVGFNKIKKVS